MLKLLTLTFLAACAIPLALADGGPTRTFVAQAYQSPYPIGQQLSGAYLSADGGSFYVSQKVPGTKAKLSTDSGAKAYLDGSTPVYLDTATGALGYQVGHQNAPDGAVYISFLHTGTYTTFIPPSSLFQWIGSDNSYWFGCPVTGQADHYKIYKQVDNTNSLNNCTVFQLVAIPPS